MTGPTDTAIAADLKAAANGKGAARREPKSQLTSPPPDKDANPDEFAAWLTANLKLDDNPVVAAEQYGRHEDARLVLLLGSGLRVTFERAQDAFDAARLVRVVMIATRTQMPAYAKPDAHKIAWAILRLASLHAEDDARSEAREWGRTFLAGAQANTFEVADLGSPAGRYEALSILRGWTSDAPAYTPAAERSPLILDVSTGARWARTSDVGAHVRGPHGVAIKWGTLHSRFVEVGWEHLGQVEQRQPKGRGRIKAHLYAIPPGWDSE